MLRKPTANGQDCISNFFESTWLRIWKSEFPTPPFESWSSRVVWLWYAGRRNLWIIFVSPIVFLFLCRCACHPFSVFSVCRSFFFSTKVFSLRMQIALAASRFADVCLSVRCCIKSISSQSAFRFLAGNSRFLNIYRPGRTPRFVFNLPDIDALFYQFGCLSCVALWFAVGFCCCFYRCWPNSLSPSLSLFVPCAKARQRNFNLHFWSQITTILSENGRQESLGRLEKSRNTKFA